MEALAVAASPTLPPIVITPQKVEEEKLTPPPFKSSGEALAEIKKITDSEPILSQGSAGSIVEIVGRTFHLDNYVPVLEAAVLALKNTFGPRVEEVMREMLRVSHSDTKFEGIAAAALLKLYPSDTELRNEVSNRLAEYGVSSTRVSGEIKFGSSNEKFFNGLIESHVPAAVALALDQYSKSELIINDFLPPSNQLTERLMGLVLGSPLASQTKQDIHGIIFHTAGLFLLTNSAEKYHALMTLVESGDRYAHDYVKQGLRTVVDEGFRQEFVEYFNKECKPKISLVQR